jgi:hypothetical protein
MIKIYKKYELERDMCSELTIEAKNNGWVVYPEQSNWDLLLVRNGIQVGIQAKLRPTIKLLSQSLVPEEYPGPHYRAVAVGNTHWKERDDFAKISIALRLIYIDMAVHPSCWFYKAINNGGEKISWRYYRHFPSEILWTPPFVPKLEAGIPAPQTTSPWKIAAVKLEFIAKEKGWVSIIDAKEIVQQEVPVKKIGSYPRSLLQSYFVCTNERDPRNVRCKKWVLKRKKPSDQYFYVFEALKGKKENARD